MPAAEGLGGARDVGDAVHGGGGGAGGGGHEDGQVWHLRQVDDSWREKQEDCQDTTERLEWGVVLRRADPSHCSGAEQEMPAHTQPLGAGCQGRGPSCGQIQPVLLLEITGRKMLRLSLWSEGAAGSDSRDPRGSACGEGATPRPMRSPAHSAFCRKPDTLRERVLISKDQHCPAGKCSHDP